MNKKKAKERRTKRLPVRLTESELKILTKKAKKAKMTVSTLVRYLLSEWIFDTTNQNLK